MGVWSLNEKIQGPLYLKAFEAALQHLTKQKDGLKQIKRIDFSWIPYSHKLEECNLVDQAKFKDSHIDITFSKRDPFTADVADKWLVVALYAWDGNAFPGK